MITSLHGAPSHWQHASNTTCPSSSPVPNQVTLSKRTMSLAFSFLFLADASMPDITPSRLFGPSQTRTERTGNNVGGSFCSVETPLVSTRALSSQSVRSLTSIRVVGVGTHLLRRIASDSGAADQVLARSTIESYVTRDPLREYTPTGLDRSVGTCGSCPQRSYKRGGGHPASIQLFAFRSVWFDAMEGAPKAKTVPTLPTLDQAHLEELSASIRGEVFRRGDQRSARTHARRQHFPLTLPYLVFTSRLACSMETLSTPQGPSYCPLTHGMSHSKHCRFLSYVFSPLTCILGSFCFATNTSCLHQSRLAGTAQAGGPSMATLLSTCPGYRKWISSPPSQAVVATRAYATSSSPLTRARLAWASPFSIFLVQQRRSARSKPRPRMPPPPVSRHQHGCTVPPLLL